MPTSKVIRPAVFDETGEHVIPADADLNLDPVSSDPDNYIVRGSDGGAFLNGDGVLSNDGENLLKTSPNDGKVTYPRSGAVSLITETVKPSLDKLGKKHDEDTAALQRAADKAQATADKAAESAKKADEDAAAAQCTATQALNDAADAKADADKAQARADAAYDKASDAQCAAADALDKAKEAVDKLPEIADAHSSIVTAGDGIKVDQSKLGDHNVYQVSVKRNGDDSGLISSSDGLEVELKGNGGLDKDKDGLYVDQQWLDEIVARYAKDHMLFNQFKIVKQLPEIPDADVHTLYLIRNRDSSAADVAPKDSFNGWFIATTENGTQKWEEVGYKTDLRGYTHAGNTVKLTGDATGTGTVDANGNVVVPTAVSHAASADKTTGGTVSITGYVSGTGSFDRNGNVTVDVVPNIRATPSTWYVGKTGTGRTAKDYWGEDENGAAWGSTKDHPFATVGFAVNQVNRRLFPGSRIAICILDSGEYTGGGENENWEVYSPTRLYADSGIRPVIRGWIDIYLNGTAVSINIGGIDFAIRHEAAETDDPDGVALLRLHGTGLAVFANNVRLIIDDNNYGKNNRGFLNVDEFVKVRTIIDSASVPALSCVLKGDGVTCTGGFMSFAGSNSMDHVSASLAGTHVYFSAPSGTKVSGAAVALGKFTSLSYFNTGVYPHYPVYFGWDIADESDLVQVRIGNYGSLTLSKNPDKGQALPGHAVGTVPDTAEYNQY